MLSNLSLMSLEAFKIYAICSCILALNLLVLSGMTGGARSRTKSFVNPEDAGKARDAEKAPDHPDVIRVGRAHGNAVENIPIFWAVGFIYVLSGVSGIVSTIVLITFTVARVLHSFFHLKAMQPFRSMSYGIGSLALAVMIVQVFIAAFKA